MSRWQEDSRTARAETADNSAVSDASQWLLLSILHAFGRPSERSRWQLYETYGQILHLKGQVSLDVEGQIIGRGDMRAQMRNTLENIREVLESIGGRISDVLSLIHYASDIGAFTTSGGIRDDFVAALSPLQVQRLYYTDLMIEVTAIAEIPRSRARLPYASATIVENSRDARE